MIVTTKIAQGKSIGDAHKTHSGDKITLPKGYTILNWTATPIHKRGRGNRRPGRPKGSFKTPIMNG